MQRKVVVILCLFALFALVVAAFAGGKKAGASSAAATYPVPYSFLLSAGPAGANARHPNPVVLAHGLMGNKNTNWQTFAPLLANNGYCVFALTYGVSPGTPLPLNQFGGLTSMESSATQLAAFVDKVLVATHAKKVDILGHSEGTQMPDYYAKFLGGAAKIDKYVSLAPIWHGTDALGLASLGMLTGVRGSSAIVNGVFAPCRLVLPFVGG